MLDDAVRELERRRVLADREWAADEARLRALVRDWELRVDGWYAGGVGIPVLAVRTVGGRPAVLKLDSAQQARVLRAAGGVGYVRVLRSDGEAVLLERLGAPVHARLTPTDQVRQMVATLQAAWRLPLTVGETIPGSKAAHLAGIIERLGPVYGGRWPEALALAHGYAVDLASEAREEVVCHGDPHPGNLLARGNGWAYVDPDGFVGERSYDIGVVLRGWCDEYRAADVAHAGDGRRMLAELLTVAIDASGENRERVRRWAYVERVTTGLFLHHLGFGEEGTDYLDIADHLR